MKNAINPEMKEKIRRVIRSVCVSEGINLFIATAEPVRVLFIINRVTKLNVITIVFIAPRSIIKLFFDCSTSSEPITAACPDPIPGRNEQSGAEMDAPKMDLKKSFFVGITSFNLHIF